MKQIEDFAAKLTESLANIGASLDGIGTDLKTLNDKITELQNSQGTLTPEDQALLDDIQAKAGAAADKVKALDDLTAPPTPPAP